MITISNTYNKVAPRHASPDRLDCSNGGSIIVDDLSWIHDYLRDTCYGDILASEEDVRSVDEDRLYEPPIVFNQDNKDEYKKYKESFEYLVKNGSAY